MYKICKRIFDIVVSAAGLILFAVPIIFLGILIKLTSKGPMIYWSKRTGLNNKIFSMAKLRSMKTDAPELSTANFPGSSEYYTCFGKFLRNTGLDELPQLFNILKGDMSLVGPRPVILDDQETIIFRNYKNINTIKPGLTGLAQIHGRSKISINEKIYYDEYYMKYRNFKMDIYIIFFTNLFLFKENFLISKKPPKTDIAKIPFVLSARNFLEL